MNLVHEPWRAKALCAGTPYKFFFDRAYEDNAKTICANCPVQQECRAWAMGFSIYDNYGVVGGLNPQERKAERLSSVKDVDAAPSSAA